MSHIILNSNNVKETTFRKKGEPLVIKDIYLPNHLLNSSGELVSERPELKGHLIVSLVDKNDEKSGYPILITLIIGLGILAIPFLIKAGIFFGNVVFNIFT